MIRASSRKTVHSLAPTLEQRTERRGERNRGSIVVFSTSDLAKAFLENIST
jgi:hypothetical protein